MDLFHISILCIKLLEGMYVLLYCTSIHSSLYLAKHHTFHVIVIFQTNITQRFPRRKQALMCLSIIPENCCKLRTMFVNIANKEIDNSIEMIFASITIENMRFKHNFY
jgi:hypothetical protein